MADLYSREQIIKNLELLYENYGKAEILLKERGDLYDDHAMRDTDYCKGFDLTYCRGVKDGILCALRYLRVQNPILK